MCHGRRGAALLCRGVRIDEVLENQLEQCGVAHVTARTRDDVRHAALLKLVLKHFIDTHAAAQ